jgi:hypothetical protein
MKVISLFLQIVMVLWLAFMVGAVIWTLTWGAYQAYTSLPL